MGGTSSSRIKDNKRVDDDSVEGAILSNCVVMFSTTTCKFCEKAKLSLANLGVRYKVIELDLLGKNSFVYSKELSLKTGVRTVCNSDFMLNQLCQVLCSLAAPMHDKTIYFTHLGILII